MILTCKNCLNTFSVIHPSAEEACPRCGTPIPVIKADASERAATLGSRPETVAITHLDDYAVESPLKHVSLGEYFIVRTSDNRRFRAILLDDWFCSDEERLNLWEEVVTGLFPLSHQNLIGVVDCGRVEDSFYYVTELVEAENVDEIVAKSKLRPDAVRSMARQVCAALLYLQQNGHYHGLITPERIFILPHDEVKLDEIAGMQLIDIQQRLAYPYTARELFILSPYLAPESRLPAPRLDIRSDIYSLGAIMYRALTGVEPVGAYVPPSNHKESIPPKLDRVISTMLKQVPEERFQTIEELITALEESEKTSSMWLYVIIVLGVLVIVGAVLGFLFFEKIQGLLG